MSEDQTIKAGEIKLHLSRSADYKEAVLSDGTVSVEVDMEVQAVTMPAWKLKVIAQRIAALEAQNALLRAVAEDCVTLLEQIIGWRIGIMGEFGEVYSGSVSRKRIGEMYLKAVAAIDGGAMGEGAMT